MVSDPKGGGHPEDYDISGSFEMAPEEFEAKIKKVFARWRYRRINKMTANCNHFTADLLKGLGVEEEMGPRIFRALRLAEKREKLRKDLDAFAASRGSTPLSSLLTVIGGAVINH